MRGAGLTQSVKVVGTTMPTNRLLNHFDVIEQVRGRRRPPRIDGPLESLPRYVGPTELQFPGLKVVGRDATRPRYIRP